MTLTDDELKERFLAELPTQGPDTREWYETRPPKIQEAILKRPPIFLYELNGNKVVLYSYEEPEDDSPVTMRVLVLDAYNENLIFERGVLGVPLENLKPICHVSDAHEHEVKRNGE